MATIAMLCGITFGAGLAWLVLYRMGFSFSYDREGEVASRGKHDIVTVSVSIVLFVAVLALTRWITLAIACAALFAFRDKLFGATAANKKQIDELEGLAMWTEALRDSMSSGSGLLEALRATSMRPPEAIAEPMRDLAGRLANREPLERALRTLADDLDDTVADEVLAALILNARAQGRQLRAVLSALAHSTRNTVESRREIEASRASLRRSSTIIIVIVLAVVMFMGIGMPQYADAYRNVTGQMMMAVILAMFFGGFFVMRQLSVIAMPRRFLTGGETA